MVNHAENELRIRGLLDDPVGKFVMELIEVYDNQGHGENRSAQVFRLFNKLRNYEVLSPLTGEEDEWKSDGQNKRCPNVFREEDGRVYHTEAIKWCTSGGVFAYFGRNIASGVPSRQYFKQLPAYPKTFYIGEHETDLSEVWEIYEKWE